MLTEQKLKTLLALQGLSVEFVLENISFKAVDDLSFSLPKSKVLGIVGESGCGKTITSLSILKLLPNTANITSGEIIFNNNNIVNYSDEQMRLIRGNHIALIPQDPLTSLNPVYTIGDQISEVIELHQKLPKKDVTARIIEVLNQVKIPDSKRIINCYPHELSGGMRQRVIIAMALACKPQLLIADEPTTALDVTVEAQILNLIRNIQKEEEMSLLLITHDLGVIANMCHDVIVMYAGKMFEYASAEALFKDPLHPYTIGLMKSLPAKKSIRLEQIEGQPPSLYNLPYGCYFEPRCPKRLPECKTTQPELFSLADGRKVRCLLYSNI